MLREKYVVLMLVKNKATVITFFVANVVSSCPLSCQQEVKMFNSPNLASQPCPL